MSSYQQMLKQHLQCLLGQLRQAEGDTWVLYHFLKLQPNDAGGWTLTLAEEDRSRKT